MSLFVELYEKYLVLFLSFTSGGVLIGPCVKHSDILLKLKLLLFKSVPQIFFMIKKKITHMVHGLTFASKTPIHITINQKQHCSCLSLSSFKGNFSNNSLLAVQILWSVFVFLHQVPVVLLLMLARIVCLIQQLPSRFSRAFYSITAL